METQILSRDIRHYKLIKGLMVYESRDRNAPYLITEHEVGFDEHGPQLLSGRYVTEGFLRTLVASYKHLDEGVPFLPEQVLAYNPDMMLWWVPASLRVMFYGGQDPLLQKLSGQVFPHPPLLFQVVERQVRLFALPENKRPTPETPLQRAPYMNMLGQDVVCRGSTVFPDTLKVSNTEGWVEGYFRSAFTQGHVPISWKGTYGEFLQHTQQQGVFPLDVLMPQGNTLQSLLKGP